MATLAPTPTGTLIEQLRALHVSVGIFHMPAGTVVDECTYRDHLHPAPATTEVYTDDDGTLDVCVGCAVRIATEQDITKVDVKVIANPTITVVDDNPPRSEQGRVAFMDRDGRFGTAEVVGVEFELNVGARPALRFDVSTPAGLAAARVLRAQLDAVIEAA